MHPADITAALKKANSSQAHIARKLGVTQTTVCAVVKGRRRSQRIENAIARATGIQKHDLWPQHKPSRTTRVIRNTV